MTTLEDDIVKELQDKDILETGEPLLKNKSNAKTSHTKALTQQQREEKRAILEANRKASGKKKLTNKEIDRLELENDIAQGIMATKQKQIEEAVAKAKAEMEEQYAKKQQEALHQCNTEAEQPKGKGKAKAKAISKAESKPKAKKEKKIIIESSSDSEDYGNNSSDDRVS